MLAQGPHSALELAGALLLTRREVEEHLEHLGRSLGKRLQVEAAQCRACGYEFSRRRRRRLDAPGRCPHCRGQRIDGPWFHLEP